LTKSKTIRLPLGVHDHLPERSRALHAHNEAVGRVFDLAGYDRVETPIFEILDVIERGLGGTSKETLFRAVDPSTGEMLVLRPDFTAQVARMVVARMAERPRPLRLRYQGQVLRAQDPLGRGLKSRDVFQAGVELIGSGEAWADAEIVSLGASALHHLSRPLTIDLGHAQIVEALLETERDVDEPAVHAALSVKDASAIRRLAPTLEPLLELAGGMEVLQIARRVLARAPQAVASAIGALERIANGLLERMPELSLSFDLGEERGLGYYTGAFFHGYVHGAGDAVLMGGRYDKLLAKYGKSEPAVGLAIDVDAIVSVMQKEEASPRGWVFAEKDPTRPELFADLVDKRRQGERAVVVERSIAETYARANGYRMIAEKNASGETVVREVVRRP
jgi:ATP phosphoribosyltransferase regulatory subunit